MKNLGMILKILAVIVAVAGAIYVIVVYGDKIADGVKKAVKFVKKKFFDKDRADFADLAAGISLTSEEYGVAFRKDSDITAKFNAFMEKLIADGTLQALADKYELTLAADK